MQKYQQKFEEAIQLIENPSEKANECKPKDDE
jgi:hypothetical protein